VRQKSEEPKFIYDKSIKREVSNINAYLVEGDNIIVHSKRKPISDFPKMSYGNQSLDDGYLLLSQKGKEDLIADDKRIEKFIRPFVGSQEFINDINRWCIWIEDDQLERALNIPEIRNRVNLVKEFRENGGQSAQSRADVPHRFATRRQASKSQLVIPLTSSQRRNYIPIGFLGSKYIISQTAQVIYEPKPYLMGVISSKMHMAWLKAVAGRLKQDYRYSSRLCYNTFPFPAIDSSQKEEIKIKVMELIQERERYSEKNLAYLYDPDKMPEGLKNIHDELDQIIDSCYKEEPFISDKKRLKHLFKRYKEMIAEEEN
jgi:hypothetical protein